MARYRDQEVRRRLGVLVWVRRHQLGLSCEALAERLGSNTSTVSRIENGQTSVGVDLLLHIARALEADPAEWVKALAADVAITARYGYGVEKGGRA